MDLLAIFLKFKNHHGMANADSINMKKHLLPMAIFMAGSLGIFRASAELEVSAGISINAAADFYQPLAAQGTWVEVGTYGRCWRPSGVAVEWRPYCDGSWEWTDAGWYWVSDEPWAWACYHYGTWVDDSHSGWLWVPAVEWAPAWVVWRTGGDHIGWAPCGPSGFTVEPSFFVFVESRHFHDRIRPNTVIVNNTTIINNSSEINNTRPEEKQFDGKSQTVMVNEGPGVDAVEKATGKKFTPVSVREADRRTAAKVPKNFNRQATSPQNVMPAPAPVEKPRPGEPLKPVPGGNHGQIPGDTHEIPQNVTPKKELPVEKEIPPELKTPPVASERKVIPEEKLVPPEHKEKEVPLQKEQRHPNELVPPAHQPVQPVPVAPSENQASHENGHDRDKDHGP